MLTCASTATDSEILAIVESWLYLLEQERYDVACEEVNVPGSEPWTPEILKRIVKEYSLRRPAQRITVNGDGGARRQRRDVQRFEDDDGDNGTIGYVWHDLNLDFALSDLTATFDLIRKDAEIILALDDIHVM